MKKALSLCLAVALLLLCAAPAAFARGSYLGNVEVVNCQSWVTLRAWASTSADTVTRVPRGAYVEAYHYNSEFAECYYRGMHGYILVAYLDADAPGYLGTRRIVNCNEFVTLREYPSTTAPAVTRVAKGQQVEAYYYDGEFCRCTYRGLEGYILSRYLGY